jgi:hypothetical protein
MEKKMEIKKYFKKLKNVCGYYLNNKCNYKNMTNDTRCYFEPIKCSLKKCPFIDILNDIIKEIK